MKHTHSPLRTQPRWPLTLLSLGIFTCSLACGPSTPNSTQIYEQIFKGSCAFQSCHGSGAGGMTLTPEGFYTAIVGAQSSRETGNTLILPNKPNESLLYKLLSNPVGSTRRMPPTNAISQEKIDLLNTWILAGAPK